MADNVTTNISEVNAKFAKMSQALQGKILETAVHAGLLPIETHAKVIVHRLTSTLSRSIHIVTTSSGAKAQGQVGTDVEYALVEEFRAGGGHAYMRPAYDAEKEKAIEEVADTLKELVERSA